MGEDVGEIFTGETTGELLGDVTEGDCDGDWVGLLDIGELVGRVG